MMNVASKGTSGANAIERATPLVRDLLVARKAESSDFLRSVSSSVEPGCWSRSSALPVAAQLVGLKAVRIADGVLDIEVAGKGFVYTSDGGRVIAYFDNLIPAASAAAFTGEPLWVVVGRPAKLLSGTENVMLSIQRHEQLKRLIVVVRAELLTIGEF